MIRRLELIDCRIAKHGDADTKRARGDHAEWQMLKAKLDKVFPKWKAWLERNPKQ